MLTRALEQEEAEKERWREQLEWRKAEKEQERQRATQEWNLRMEELRLRNEELKRSEEKSIETQGRLERKEEQRRLQRRAEKMEPWRDCDQPEAYLVKFERVMTEVAIPGDEWANRLVPLLTGKVLAAYHAQVPPTAAKSYDELKEALLDALGLSVDHCRRKFWSFHRKYSDSPQEVLRQIETTFHGLTHRCKSVKEMEWEMVLGRFLSTYSSDVVDYVMLCKPKTTVEAANLVQNYLEGKQGWRDRRPFGSKPYDRGASGLCDEQSRADHVCREVENKGEQHAQGGSHKPGVSSQKDGTRQGSTAYRDYAWKPTCFTCGNKGHKQFECPKCIRRVVSPKRRGPPMVVGKVGKKECEVTIDSGAQLTLVREDLVDRKEYTGETLNLMSVCGKTFTVPAARVWLHFGEYSIEHVVAVSKDLREAVLLGMDLDLLDYLLQLEKEQNRRGLAVNALTRAQTKKLAEEEKRDEQLSAISCISELQLP